jgi:hypothetical protein
MTLKHRLHDSGRFQAGRPLAATKFGTIQLRSSSCSDICPVVGYVLTDVSIRHESQSLSRELKAKRRKRRSVPADRSPWTLPWNSSAQRMSVKIDRMWRPPPKRPSLFLAPLSPRGIFGPANPRGNGLPSGITPLTLSGAPLAPLGVPPAPSGAPLVPLAPQLRFLRFLLIMPCQRGAGETAAAAT